MCEVSVVCHIVVCECGVRCDMFLIVSINLKHDWRFFGVCFVLLPSKKKKLIAVLDESQHLRHLRAQFARLFVGKRRLSEFAFSLKGLRFQVERIRV